jgi:putative DNA primase/helicase
MTIDSRTGRNRSGEKKDMITKRTAVAPEAEGGPGCPLWLAFLDDATADDQDLIAYLQRWCGYCLTGSTTEQVLVFLFGPGGNGKSVFVNTIKGIMGDYCITAGMDIFTSSKGDRHPQELARLMGARLVCASETTEGRSWDETRIKQMTGGDPITARFMRQNDFTFIPQFKIMIAGNNKPVLRNVDDAMRRRLSIVPFLYKPKRPDHNLESKLRVEWPAILSWMVAGCLDWQKGGLRPPKVVRYASAQYVSDQDSFGQWIEAKCEVGKNYVATIAELFDSWSSHAGFKGETLLGRSKGFPDEMDKRGFSRIRDTNGIRGRGFRGIRLADTQMYEDDAQPPEDDTQQPEDDL